MMGGFKHDTDKADIEETLRSIMEGTAGVERITSLGKFASVGKVAFKDKNMMWDFIKAHKGERFPNLGDARALWFSIEKTEEERTVARKVGIMVRALVGHLIDVGKIDPCLAMSNIEADYVKGILVFREDAPILTTDADTLVKTPRP